MISFDDTEKMTNQTPLMKKIEHGADIIFKINKYTTPITFEFKNKNKSTYSIITRRSS